MGLYNYALYDAEGGLIRSGNWRGSCTGVYQAGGFNFPNLCSVDQSFAVRGVPSMLLEQLPTLPLFQSLVPGLRFRNSDGHFVSYHFPGLDTLPADQVITAMRLLKSHAIGWYMRQMRVLREYEFPLEAQSVLAAFINVSAMCCESDSVPVLAMLRKSTVANSGLVTGRTSYSISSSMLELKEEPFAGMLLPLIRGETKPGWQSPLGQGYRKEMYILCDWAQGRNDYNALSVIQSCPDESNVTINNPLIFDEPEHRVGPRLPFSPGPDGVDRYLTQAADWVASQLNY